MVREEKRAEQETRLPTQSFTMHDRRPAGSCSAAVGVAPDAETQT